MTSKEAMKRIKAIKELKKDFNYGEWTKITALDSGCTWLKVINCSGWHVSIYKYEWKPEFEMYLSYGHSVIN